MKAILAVLLYPFHALRSIWEIMNLPDADDLSPEEWEAWQKKHKKDTP